MDKRKLKIALSLAVLIPCVLYAAGIIAQFIININAWKAAGSDYRISPGLPSSQISEVVRALFHFPEGLIAIGVVVLGIAVLCVFGLRIGWGQNGVTDSDRNLTVSNSGSYGTASFMSPKEASACFEVTSAKRTSQDILGMLPDGQVLTLPKDTRLNANLAVCGSSGTGKSRAISRNLVLQAVKRGESVILTDPKSELYESMGEYFVTEVSAPKYYQLSSEKMEAEIEYPNQIIKLSAYNKSANLGVTIKKTGNREVQPGQVMSYDFSGIGNTSNVALNSFFWHDRIPTDATRAISVTTGTYNARLYYKVTFKTNLSDYRTLASNLLTSNNYSLSLNAATLGLAQGEYVTDVRFEFGTVPSGFASVVKPTMRVQVLGTVSNGYQIINRADVGGQYLNEWQTTKATWVTTVCRFNNNPLPKTGY